MNGTRLGVYGLAIRDQRILLTRISAMVPGGAGKWTLPGGGVEWGESPVDTLTREFREETGLVPAVGNVLDIRSLVVNRPDRAGNWHVLQAVYSVSAEGDPFVTEVAGSCDAAAWHPLAGLPDLSLVSLVPYALELVAR
jgi:ADP-ribose pyrophosphatase YjhB (NUDIX family)